uniref:SFRICE_010232 n=1 Tax=Spodoptera frugiperda TaxID=7108 RepID=A0A2H1WKK3_SPOFR
MPRLLKPYTYCYSVRSILEYGSQTQAALYLDTEKNIKCPRNHVAPAAGVVGDGILQVVHHTYRGQIMLDRGHISNGKNTYESQATDCTVGAVAGQLAAAQRVAVNKLRKYTVHAAQSTLRTVTALSLSPRHPPRVHSPLPQPARWAPVAMFLHHTFRQLAIDIAAGTRPSPPGDVVMFDFNSKLLVSMTCSCCLLFDEHH